MPQKRVIFNEKVLILEYAHFDALVEVNLLVLFVFLK
jgi:hypothetical protein